MKESLPVPDPVLHAQRLFSELTTALTAYKKGTGDLQVLSRILNELQQLTFEKLQRDGKITHTGDYQDYGQSAVDTTDGTSIVYTKLGEKHPVIIEQNEQVEKEEFNRWRSTFVEAYGEVSFPESGTTSDLFKIVLRYLITRFRYNLSPDLITTIQLRYILNQEIDEDAFVEAYQTILDSVISK